MFLRAFIDKDDKGNLRADFDGDGVVNQNEAIIYRMLHYNQSLTPTTFEDKDGNRRHIAHNNPQP